MTEKEFAKIYANQATLKKEPGDEKVPSGLNESKEKTNDPAVGKVAVTHPVDGGKKHPRIGCAWDAMGPYAGSGENGPFDGIADGEGAQVCEGAPSGDGGAMGESISPKQFNACMESICVEFPGASGIIDQIKKMFNSVQAGGSGKLYCSADGCESDAEPDDSMASDSDTAISAAAATVEAALTTFRQVAGCSYEEFKAGAMK